MISLTAWICFECIHCIWFSIFYCSFCYYYIKIMILFNGFSWWISERWFRIDIWPWLDKDLFFSIFRKFIDIWAIGSNSQEIESQRPAHSMKIGALNVLLWLKMISNGVSSSFNPTEDDVIVSLQTCDTLQNVWQMWRESDRYWSM